MALHIPATKKEIKWKPLVTGLGIVALLIGFWVLMHYEDRQREALRDDFVQTVEQTTALVNEDNHVFEQVASGRKPVEAIEDHAQKTVLAFENVKVKADRLVEKADMDPAAVSQYKEQIANLQAILTARSLVANTDGAEALRRHTLQAITSYLTQTESFLSAYKHL